MEKRKTYILRVVIREGSDEFWDELKDRSGCDEVVEAVKEALGNGGWGDEYGCTVELERFETSEPRP